MKRTLFASVTCLMMLGMVSCRATQPEVAVGSAVPPKATLDAEPSAQVAAMEGLLEFEKPIRVGLRSGVGDEEDVVFLRDITFKRERWLMFPREDGEVSADIRAPMTGLPAGQWHVTVRLLDAEGREVAAAAEVFDNHGFPLFAGKSPRALIDLHVAFGHVSGVSRATRFRVDLESLRAPATQPEAPGF